MKVNMINMVYVQVKVYYIINLKDIYQKNHYYIVEVLKMDNIMDMVHYIMKKIMIIKQVNENTNKEHFITLNLAQYDGIRISTYKCHIFLIYTSMNNNNNNINNNNSTNKCQRAIDNCDWH